MLRFIFVVLLLLSVALPDARAEEELCWKDCLKEAEQNHPDLISAREALNQAKSNRAITRSSALPQISSDLSAKTAKAATGATSDTYTYGLSGKQLLFDGFKTSYNIAAATEDVKSAQYSYDVTSTNIRLDLRTAFVELLKAQELLGITQDIAARRKENLEMVKLRYEAGREHKGSLLNAQANAAQAEFEVAQAKRNIDLTQRQLSRELGRTKFSPIKAKGDLQILSTEQESPDFEHLAEHNPFLLELITKKESARFDLKSARADFFPEVSANASTGRSDAHWPPGDDTWSAGVSLSFPVFEGGSRLAQVSKARAALNQAEADERSGKDGLVFTLVQAWKELQDAIDKVEVEQKFLAAAEERAKITQAQYSIGVISFDDWSIIEDNLVNARKSFLNAKTDALVKEASWIEAKGGTLDYE